MGRTLGFLGLLGGTLLMLLAGGWAGVSLGRDQVLSVLIFSTFIYATLLFSRFRLAFAMGGLALLLGLNLLSVDRLGEAANLKVILFLVGMFLVVGFLEDNQFFETVVDSIVRAIGPHPARLVMAMMLMATVSAALVDEVTSILFMAGAMLHLAKRYQVNPVPFVIMVVFATNTGSAATPIGNPIGVMIALDAGLTFGQFVRWAAPVVLVADGAVYAICRWWFRAEFSALGAAMRGEAHGNGEVRASPASQHLSWLIFSVTVGLLAFHGLADRALGVAPGTMMVASAMGMGGVVLLIRHRDARELVERRVDWWTLLFFLLLFVSVATLQQTHVTGLLAARLIDATGGDQGKLVQVVGWSTGVLSGFLDNVLAVATFLPVVHDIRVAATPAAYPASVYWMMLFGGTFMGNLTVIGSTANIIACGMLERRGHRVGFMEWLKIGVIVSLVSMMLATVMMLAQARWMGVVPPPR